MSPPVSFLLTKKCQRNEYQISYNSGNGYVSAEFLSDKEPANKTATGSTQFTGTVKTIYSLDGTAITIYESSDGEWYDSKGGKFTWIGDDRLTNEGGEAFTTYDSTVDDDED